MSEFSDSAKNEYEKLAKELQKKEDEAKAIRDKMRPFKVFLEESGVFQKQTRSRNGVATTA